MGIFESVLSINLDPSAFLDPRFLSIAAIYIMLIVVIGGLYPLLVLSRVRPVPLLPTEISQSAFAKRTSQLVLAAQAAISTALVMSIIVMSGQLNFIETDDFGMDPQNVITFRLEPSDAGRYIGLQNELKTILGVENVGASNTAIFDDVPPITMLTRSDSSVTIAASIISIDSSLISTLQITGSQAPSTNGFLINRAAANAFLIGSESKEFAVRAGSVSMPILGIVDDFNFTDKKQRISPLAMSVADDSAKVFAYTGCSVYVKLWPGVNEASSLLAITQVYQKHFPGKVLSAEYLTAKINAMYAEEHSVLKAFSLFTTIGVTVSLFGVVGLLIFNIATKMGELSIRKLLGAGPSHLSYFLSKDTGTAVLLGAAVGVVVSLFFLNDWLNAFAYRISIGPGHIIGCLALIFLSIVAVSVAFVLRAINTSPIIFLRKDE